MGSIPITPSTLRLVRYKKFAYRKQGSIGVATTFCENFMVVAAERAYSQPTVARPRIFQAIIPVVRCSEPHSSGKLSLSPCSAFAPT